MKKVIIAAVLLFSSANMIVAMDQAKVNQIHYMTTKMNLSVLQEKANKGDMASALALYDFYENLKDRNYAITYEPSIKALAGLALIDTNNKVHGAVREAFKQCEPSK